MISPLPKLWALRYIDSSIIIDKSRINQLQVSHKTKGSGQAEHQGSVWLSSIETRRSAATSKTQQASRRPLCQVGKKSQDDASRFDVALVRAFNNLIALRIEEECWLIVIAPMQMEMK